MLHIPGACLFSDMRTDLSHGDVSWGWCQSFESWLTQFQKFEHRPHTVLLEFNTRQRVLDEAKTLVDFLEFLSENLWGYRGMVRQAAMVPCNLKVPVKMMQDGGIFHEDISSTWRAIHTITCCDI